MDVENGMRTASYASDYNELDQKLFDKLPLMMFRLDEEGRVMDVNEKWLITLGYTRTEVIGYDPVALFDEDSRETIHQLIHEQLPKTDHIPNTPCHFLHKHGMQIPVLLSIYVDRIEGGQARQAVCVCIDISNTKEMQLALSLSDNILSKVQNIILVSDINGDILYTTPYTSEFLGFPMEDLIGNGWWELVKKGMPDIKEETAKKARRELEVSDKSYESKVWAADGSEYTMLFKDALGPANLLIGVAYDITERKKASEQLHRYSSRIEFMLEIEKAILTSESSDEILYGVLKKLVVFLEYCNRISFTTFDIPNNEAQFFYADAEKPNALGTGRVIPLDEFGSYEQVKDGHYALVNNLSEKAELSVSDKELLESNINSYLIIPVIYQNQLIGSLNLGSSLGNPFRDVDIQLMQEIANEIGIAMMHHKLLNDLEEKNRLIRNKNKDITDSLNYAKRIQEAFFPATEFNDIDIRNESFVVFKPKDIVSGDFFWVAYADDCTYFAVVDCTGHGVPGAMISIVGFNLLNRAIDQMGLTDVKEILQFIHEQHIQTFHSDSSRDNIQDGMDIGLVKLDNANKTIEYAGAHHSLYLYTQNELKIYRGKRMAIGSTMHNEVSFDKYIISVNKGDCIWLSTDGYLDQFGGKSNKKFRADKFKQLLLDIRKHPMKEQKRILEETMNEWMGDNEQVDDICVVGVRV